MYEPYMSHNLVRTSPFYTSPFLRVGFWQNGFFADFYFWAAGFFRGFCRRIFLLILVGKRAQKNPPGKSPAKSSKIYTTKIPDTFLQRGRANVLQNTRFCCLSVGWQARAYVIVHGTFMKPATGQSYARGDVVQVWQQASRNPQGVRLEEEHVCPKSFL